MFQIMQWGSGQILKIRSLLVNVRQQFKATAEKGIGTSCTILQILFAMGMSLMKTAAERTTREVCNVPTTEKIGTHGRPYRDNHYLRTS